MSAAEELVEVYRAAGEPEALVIKSLLESNGIRSIIISNAAPSVHVLTVNGLGEYRVMVAQPDEEAARQLIVR